MKLSEFILIFVTIIFLINSLTLKVLGIFLLGISMCFRKNNESFDKEKTVKIAICLGLVILLNCVVNIDLDVINLMWVAGLVLIFLMNKLSERIDTFSSVYFILVLIKGVIHLWENL